MAPKCFIFFEGEISPESTQALKQALMRVKNDGHREAYIVFSTPGGHVPAGIALHQFIRGMPFKVTMHNIGNVDSIGSAAFLAASRRYASPHSTFLFHGVGVERKGRMDSKTLKELLSGVQADESRIADIISSRSAIDKEGVEGFFLAGQTKTAQEALNLGLVDDIRHFELPQGAPTIYIEKGPAPAQKS